MLPLLPCISNCLYKQRSCLCTTIMVFLQLFSKASSRETIFLQAKRWKLRHFTNFCRLLLVTYCSFVLRPNVLRFDPMDPKIKYWGGAMRLIFFLLFSAFSARLSKTVSCQQRGLTPVPERHTHAPHPPDRPTKCNSRVTLGVSSEMLVWCCQIFRYFFLRLFTYLPDLPLTAWPRG